MSTFTLMSPVQETMSRRCARSPDWSFPAMTTSVSEEMSEGESAGTSPSNSMANIFPSFSQPCHCEKSDYNATTCRVKCGERLFPVRISRFRLFRPLVQKSPNWLDATVRRYHSALRGLRVHHDLVSRERADVHPRQHELAGGLF